MTPGLLSILTKHAAELQPKPKHQELLDKHFSAHENSRWRDFRRAVRSKSFVNALQSDERADDKMRRYAEGMYLHHAGKTGESFTIPGHKKNYTVKFHPKQDRFSCSCPDWGYARSHQTNKAAQDCKHIQQVKLELQSQGDKPKTAAFNIRHLAGTTNILAKKDKLDTSAVKNRAVSQAYKQQMPQPSGEGIGALDLLGARLFHKHAEVRGLAARRLLEELNP